MPDPEGPAPDAEIALDVMARLALKVDSLCRRAEDIVRAVRCTPIAVPRLKTLQQEQSRECEAATCVGMTTFATAPVTAECVRAIHNDNVQGMEQLAQHHARAYRQWRDQLAQVRRYLSEAGRQSISRRLPMIGRSHPAYVKGRENARIS